MSVEGCVWTAVTQARWTERRERAVAAGEALRIARRLAGLNQAELGALIGTSQAEVSSLERGRSGWRQTERFYARALAACAHATTEPPPGAGAAPSLRARVP